MQVKQLVALNNERKKVLTTTNLKFYDDLLVYIRLSSLKDERAKEEVLMELLEHLIEAQQNGKNAEEVFGKKPKQLAEDIVASLPSMKKASMIPFMLETILLLVGVYIASTGIFNLILKENFTVSIVSSLIYLAVLIGGFLILLQILLKQLQNTSITKSKMPFVYATIAIAVYIFVVGSVVTFVPTIGQSFIVTPVMMLVTGIVLLVIYAGMQIAQKKRQ